MKRLFLSFGLLCLFIGLSIFGAVNIGRYLEYWHYNNVLSSLGYGGTGLILLSFIYSFKKHLWRKLPGTFGFWLAFHEICTVIGGMLLFIHIGTKLAGVIPVTALILMNVVTLSGIFGKYLYIESKKYKINLYMAKQLSKWRLIHLNLVYGVVFFTFLHIITVVYLGGG